MTAEELMELPEKAGVIYELVRGELRRMTPSAALPGVVAMRLGRRMDAFVDTHKIGVCGTAESGFRLRSDPDTVRAPDVWFVRAERIPATGIPDSFWPGAPDLAVEVLSPFDRFSSVMEKVRDYLDNGARLVWVIDPKGRIAAVFREDRSGRLIGDDATLDGDDVIPRFAVTLREILP
jgi:Uma2 family endonuclease